MVTSEKLTHLLTPLAKQGPVEQISAAEIKRSGLTTIGQLLERLPIMGSGLNRTFNFNGNGDTNINLRNLGSQRVLILVNGRRWAPFLQGKVDLNTIPLAIVDHVDILKSGDSAIYGSAAMAGVINIVTRKNVTGLQLDAYGGTFVEGSVHDGQTQSYSLTDGIGNERGNLTFTLSYMNQRPIGTADRAISAVPDFGTGVTRGSSTTPQGRFIFINPNTGQTEDLTTISGTPGTSPADFRPFDPTADFYNFALVNYLQSPMKQTGLYLQGHYRFTANLSGHLSTLYNDRRSHQQEGPAELHIGSQTEFPISISKTNPYNPFGFDLDATGSSPNLLLIARQPVELGPRHVEEDVQTFYVNPGLSGDFNIAGVPFQWRSDAILSHTRFTTTDATDINMARVATALGPIDECGPGTPHPDCVPLNLFGGQFDGGTITPAMIKYIGYTAQELQESDLRDYTASVTAEPLQMAGGLLRVTAGVEHRNESGSFQPDPLSAAGIGSQSEGTPISGGYHVDAGFLSADIPVLGGLAWAKSLHVNIATRASRFDTFGTIKGNLAALHWTINSRLSAAASWSQDFRAPSIAELFTANVTGTASVVDPCSDYPSKGGTVAANCAAADVPPGYVQVNTAVPSTTGRNPNLRPETSTSRTLSITAIPFDDIPLTLQADYFKIEVDNAITMLNPQDVLDGCYVASLSNYCAFITRNASGAISDLTNTNQNLGSLLTEGMDFGVHYTWQAGAAGTFDFDWMTTWVKRFTFIQPNLTNPAEPIVEERVDTETGRPVGGYPKFKSRLTAIWNYGPWQVLWRVNYISDLIERCSDQYDGTLLSLTNLGLCSYPNYANNALSKNKLGATVYHDLQLKYSFGDGNTALTFGVLNVFDKQPPIGHSMSNSFDTTVYRIPGRFFYVNLSHEF